jgi:hypothetical protein
MERPGGNRENRSGWQWQGQGATAMAMAMLGGDGKARSQPQGPEAIAITIAIAICMVDKWWFESRLILVKIKTHPYIMFGPFVISQQCGKILKPLVLDTTRQRLSNGATPISVFPLLIELLTSKVPPMGKDRGTP